MLTPFASADCMDQPAFTAVPLGGTLLFRTRLRHLALTGAALATVVASLPPATAADSRERHLSGGGLSAVIRYAVHGIPHIVAGNYASLGFGTGWAQAADQVCVLADGFVTGRPVVPEV